jgi:hypothetical protein
MIGAEINEKNTTEYAIQSTNKNSSSTSDNLFDLAREYIPAHGLVNLILLIGCAGIGYLLLRNANSS